MSPVTCAGGGRTYSSTEVASEAAVTYRNLDYWTRLGYLRPEHEGGTGNSRKWPEGELEIARRMGRLTAAGLPLAFAAAMARDTWPEGRLAPDITVTVDEAVP